MFNVDRSRVVVVDRVPEHRHQVEGGDVLSGAQVHHLKWKRNRGTVGLPSNTQTRGLIVGMLQCDPLGIGVNREKIYHAVKWQCVICGQQIKIHMIFYFCDYLLHV